MERREVLKGLHYGNRYSYQTVLPKTRTKTYELASPTTGTSLTTNDNVVFDFVLGQDEFIKFLDQPIVISYRIKIKNPNYLATAAAGSKEKLQWLFCNETDHNVALDPSMGAAAFFSNASISLDAQPITEGIQSGSLLFVYQALNKIFTKQAVLEQQGTPYLIRGTWDRSTDATKMTNATRWGRNLTNSGAYTQEKPITKSIGIDGCLFLGRPRNNALANLYDTEKENSSMYIPPGTRVTVQLHLRPNPAVVLDWLDLDDSVYFAEAAAQGNHVKEAKVEITDIRLAYQKVVLASLPSGLQTQLIKSSLKMHFDVPSINSYLVTANSQRVEIDVLCPAGAKSLMLGFALGFQLWPSSAAKKFLSGRFVLPDELTDLTVSLSDHGPLLFSNFGPTKDFLGATNPNMETYVQGLRESGLTSEPDQVFFPRSAAEKSYHQAFFIDLRSHAIKKPTYVKVVASFQISHSPNNLYLVTTFVKETNLIRKPGGEWSLETVL